MGQRRVSPLPRGLLANTVARPASARPPKFDQFGNNLGISRNILSRRPKHSVADGFLEPKVDKGPPIRVGYLLGPQSRAFQPVLLYLHSLGSLNFTREGRAVVVANRGLGAVLPICRLPGWFVVDLVSLWLL